MKAIFSALADPKRQLIVELLRDGPLSVGEIADRLGLNQPQISKHLRVLSNAGLVEVHAIANRRIYKLRPQPLKELDTWLDSSAASATKDSIAWTIICTNCKERKRNMATRSSSAEEYEQNDIGGMKSWRKAK